MFDTPPAAMAPATSRSAAIGAPLALLIAITLVGLSAGFFVAYVSSVIRGLDDVSDVTYVETFRAINESVRNPLFGIVFFGSVPALLIATAANWPSASTVRRTLLVLALALYLAVVVITGTGNVPLNNDLADVVATSPEVATRARAAFEHDWNRLNLARTIAAVASFISVVAAAVLPDGHRRLGRVR